MSVGLVRDATGRVGKIDDSQDYEDNGERLGKNSLDTFPPLVSAAPSTDWEQSRPLRFQ